MTTATTATIDNDVARESMAIAGYRRSWLRCLATWTCYLATGGLLRLFFHWLPEYHLKATHRRCELAMAEKVLVTDIYRQKHRTQFVKDIKTISGKGPLVVHLARGQTREFHQIRLFNCKKLSYIWDETSLNFYPVCGLDTGRSCDQLAQSQPLDGSQRHALLATYGPNEIRVPINSLAHLVLLELLTPFYMFQLFSLIVWTVDNYYYYASAIVLMTVVGIGSSVAQTRSNQKKLRGTVGEPGTAHVLVQPHPLPRATPASLLVPGDVITLPAHNYVMPCDAILLQGACIVNEAMLTGESTPVTKTALVGGSGARFDPRLHSSHTLFGGTTVLQTRYYGDQLVRAVVVRTGYLTSKGDLVRRILYPHPADFRFDRDSYRFIRILVGVAAAACVYTVVSKANRGVNLRNIVLKALDILTIAIPPVLPAAMTVGRVHALRRLRRRAIYCINPRTINVCGGVDLVCFDKTGTLTEEGLDMWGAVPSGRAGSLATPIRRPAELDPASRLSQAMATCHSLTTIDGELSGDPLDLKMFEFAGWTLEEPLVPDRAKFDLLAPSVVRHAASEDLQVGIVRQFQFSSSLQRMSVVVRALGAAGFRLYCKGAPETVMALSRPETVPANAATELRRYAALGYRLLALATRRLDSADSSLLRVERLDRADAECDLTFLGLVVMENRLKAGSTACVRELRRAGVRVIMATGDNLLTALSVARECGIVGRGERVLDLSGPQPGRLALGREGFSSESQEKSQEKSHEGTLTHQTHDTKWEGQEDKLVEPLENLAELHRNSKSAETKEENQWAESLGKWVEPTELSMQDGRVEPESQSFGKKPPDSSSNPPPSLDQELSDLRHSTHRLALTGTDFRRHAPSPSLILDRGVVFARMTAEMKAELVVALQGRGWGVAMCGDGANDCGALRSAHVGISLSEAEASVASPFTAQGGDVGCVGRVLREGRAALVTSFGVFKFIVGYSLTQFLSTLVLYGIDSNLTDFQFIFIDLGLICVLTPFFGLTQASLRPLAPHSPPANLLGLACLLSLTLHLLIVVGFQLSAYYLVQLYPWFHPFTYNPSNSDDVAGFENFAVFSVSVFQYLILALVFSKGEPYRRPIHTNKPLTLSLILLSGACAFLVLFNQPDFAGFIDLVRPPDLEFPAIAIALATANLVLAVVIETLIVDWLLPKYFIRDGKKGAGAKQVEGVVNSAFATDGNSDEDIVTKL